MYLHPRTMRGAYFFAAACVLIAGASPALAAPNNSNADESDECAEPAKKKQVKSMTEPLPIRKKDRERTRRILM